MAVQATSRLLLRIPEAADVLGISRAAFYRLVQHGEIPTIKLGRAARVPVAELENWIGRRIEESRRRIDG